MIERTHLRILKEIEQLGSLTSAAEALHLTQPALSHAIKKLEAQIGTALWTKQGRNLHLTQAGQYLLSESKRLLPQLEHLDSVLTQFAQGDKGTLRIGMECHPCYQWLLTVVEPFLKQWPDVDVDVKQEFQFGGMAALFNRDIDLLVTPDPLNKPDIKFHPAFAYEQVLVTSKGHRLAVADHIEPEDLIDEVLYTYPVEKDRLDIFNQFLTPAHCSPRKHKTIEATEMMLQMVAANRGVAALPGWLVEQAAENLALTAVRLGKDGLHKHIYLGTRDTEEASEFLGSFVEMAVELN